MATLSPVCFLFFENFNILHDFFFLDWNNRMHATKWQKIKCVNIFIYLSIYSQIKDFQLIIFRKRQMYRLRRPFQRNGLLTLPAKIHRQQHQSMWTRLVRRWQTEHHTLKVSNHYQSFFITLPKSFTLRSHVCKVNVWEEEIFSCFEFHFLCLLLVCFYLFYFFLPSFTHSLALSFVIRIKWGAAVEIFDIILERKLRVTLLSLMRISNFGSDSICVFEICCSN